jgi:hypothetical protein
MDPPSSSFFKHPAHGRVIYPPHLNRPGDGAQEALPVVLEQNTE